MNIQGDLGRMHGDASAKLGIEVQMHLAEEHGITLNDLDVGVGDYSEVIHHGEAVEVVTGQEYHNGKLTGITLESKQIEGLEDGVVVQECGDMASLWDDVRRSYYLYELAGKPLSELEDIITLSGIVPKTQSKDNVPYDTKHEYKIPHNVYTVPNE